LEQRADAVITQGMPTVGLI